MPDSSNSSPQGSIPSKSLSGTIVTSSNQPTQAQATRRGHGATLQVSNPVSVSIPTLSAEAAKVLQNRKTKQAGMVRGPSAVGGGRISKMAGVQVVRAAPKVFSPLYENSNLQLPRDLRTLNAWCVSGDTKVLTEGWIWKTIETLEIGELVYTHTGILAPVKEIASRVANSYYEVGVRGEQKPVKITGEHVVKVLSFKENQCVQNHSNMCTFGNKKVCHQEPYRCRLKLPELKIREKCLDQCSVGDYTFFPIPQKSEQGIWNKDFARLLGFYLAEGTSTEGCPQVGLTFNINEKQYIEEAANLFEKCFGVRGCIWESEKDSIARVYTTNEKAREFLVKHGGRGTKNKKLSQEVLDLPAELQGYIIGAYIDGDSYQWSSEEKKTTEQTFVDSMSSILVQQLQFLFWRNEINAYLYELKRICTIGNHIGEEVTYWRLGFGKTASNKLVKYSSRIKELSATKIQSDRFFYQDKLFTKIESITKVDKTLLVYDLTIDHDDHSFVTSLGAVNNCRHFYNINPLVRNAINLHATYPISKFNLECEDKKVLHFFEDMFEQLNMPNVLHAISLEYWKLGETIVQAELDPNNGVWQHLFCFHPETEIVLAENLLIPISELKIGMQVVTHTGATKKVINTMSREYSGVMHSFYSLSNTPITVTKDHDLLVVSKEILKDDLISGRDSEYYIPVSDDISPKITLAQDVKDGDFFAIPKSLTNDKVENLPIEKALFWGHFLSEGTVGYRYIRKTKVRIPYYISIAVQKEEVVFLEQIEKSANISYPAFVRDRGKKAHQNLPAWSVRPQYYYHNCEKTHKLTEVVTGSTSIISEIIEKTSVKGSTKAENKRIPVEIFKAGKREKLAFLLAYLNGDGAVQQRETENGCTLSYSTSSPNLCAGLVSLLHSFDMIPVVDKYKKPSKTAKCPSYRICLNHCDTIRFKQLIQKNNLMIYNIGKLDVINTERSLNSDSHNRVYFNKNFFFTKIRKITQENYQGIVYNCTVEEDHSLPIHPTGIVSSQCHNPDYIRVQISPLAKDPIITLIPDEHLKRIVTSSAASDAELKRQLPPEIIALIQNGLDIPLNNFNVSHLKMLSSDYDVRGSSIITSCYKDLMLYDKLREAEFVQADDMINPITHVKLGDPNGGWKPDDTDISDMRQAFEEAMYDLDFKLVTHGAVTIEKIGNGGAVLDTSRMWDQINKNILIGLMAPEEIINGNGASYASATVGLEVLRSRYERFRNTIDAWIRRKIMEPIAKIQDFYKWEHGRRRLIVPKIVWNKMNLRDVESYLQNLTGLVGDAPGKGRISARTLFNILDIDPDSQITETRRELIEAAVREKEATALAKMSVEELLTLDHNKPITDKHPTASPSSEQSIPGETDEGGGEGGLGDLGLGGGAPPGLGDLGLGDLGGGPTMGGPSEGAPTPDLGGPGG